MIKPAVTDPGFRGPPPPLQLSFLICHAVRKTRGAPPSSSLRPKHLPDNGNHLQQRAHVTQVPRSRHAPTCYKTATCLQHPKPTASVNPTPPKTVSMLKGAGCRVHAKNLGQKKQLKKTTNPKWQCPLVRTAHLPVF